jgi:hypothetical protein
MELVVWFSLHVNKEPKWQTPDIIRCRVTLLNLIEINVFKKKKLSAEIFGTEENGERMWH